jgi:flagellar protein FliL
MSAAAAPAQPETAAAPKKSKKLVMIVVCVFFATAGAAFPMVVDVQGMLGKKEGKDKEKADPKIAIVPFGDVVVNLSEERMTRYLRIKIAVRVEAENEAEVTELLTKHKAGVKSRIITHLAGKSLKDVSGQQGVNRLKRELLERFEDELNPSGHGHGHVREVLFEEFVIQ